MMQQDNATRPKFLFAARRFKDNNGSSTIILQSLKVKLTYFVNENELRRAGVVLGDFVSVKVRGPSLLPNTIRKDEHKEKFRVAVEGDVAYIKNVKARLVPSKENFAFQSEHFSNALASREFPRGEYWVRISLMSNPRELSGIPFWLEATNPLLITPSPTNVTIGAGFPEPRPSAIVGTGFAAIPPPISKAVVLSVDERNGVNTHYLWLLEKQSEGRFVSSDRLLKKGHFFEGVFKEKKGKWEGCEYKRPLEVLVPGGIENNRLYFKVQLTDFLPARGNRKFAEASASYFDQILDNESKLSSDCIGQHVRIQRHAIDKKDFAWVVVEVL